MDIQNKIKLFQNYINNNNNNNDHQPYNNNNQKQKQLNNNKNNHSPLSKELNNNNNNNNRVVNNKYNNKSQQVVDTTSKTLVEQQHINNNNNISKQKHNNNNKINHSPQPIQLNNNHINNNSVVNNKYKHQSKQVVDTTPKILVEQQHRNNNNNISTQKHNNNNNNKQHHQQQVPLPHQLQQRKLIVPPKHQDHHGLITLVLDLDETLIQRSKEPITNPDFTIQCGNTTYYITKRPYVDQFLRYIAGKFEIIVFTASAAIYANQIIDNIDINRIIHHRLYRNHCTLNHNGTLVKDLSLLGRDLASTVIVDNSPDAYALQPQNAIPIISWYTDNEDRELLRVNTVLDDLIQASDDVRVVLANLSNSGKLNNNNKVVNNSSSRVNNNNNKIVNNKTSKFNNNNINSRINNNNINNIGNNSNNIKLKTTTNNNSNNSNNNNNSNQLKRGAVINIKLEDNKKEEVSPPPPSNNNISNNLKKRKKLDYNDENDNNNNRVSKHIKIDTPTSYHKSISPPQQEEAAPKEFKRLVSREKVENKDKQDQQSNEPLSSNKNKRKLDDYEEGSRVSSSSPNINTFKRVRMMIVKIQQVKHQLVKEIIKKNYYQLVQQILK